MKRCLLSTFHAGPTADQEVFLRINKVTSSAAGAPAAKTVSSSLIA